MLWEDHSAYFLVIEMKGKIVNTIMGAASGVIEVDPKLKNLSDNENVPFVNGCGAEDSFLSYFVPQHIDGIDIRAACLNHDCRYTFGKTLGDKIKADINLEHDLKLLIAASPDNLAVNKYHRQRRFDEAGMFFMFVSLYGEKAFMTGVGKSRPLKDIINELPSQKYLKHSLRPVGHRGSEDPDDEYL